MLYEGHVNKETYINAWGNIDARERERERFKEPRFTASFDADAMNVDAEIGMNERRGGRERKKGFKRNKLSTVVENS
jgi:hypothetical protein